MLLELKQELKNEPKGHLLIVDDEPGMCSLLSDVFESEGFTVTTCSHGDEAWKVMQNSDQKIDLVVSDQNMPGMKGLDLLDKMNTQNQGPPFILVTAFGGEEINRIALKKGAFGYLSKPFPLCRLVELVKEGIALSKVSERKGDGVV